VKLGVCKKDYTRSKKYIPDSEDPLQKNVHNVRDVRSLSLADLAKSIGIKKNMKYSYKKEEREEGVELYCQLFNLKYTELPPVKVKVSNAKKSKEKSSEKEPPIVPSEKEPTTKTPQKSEKVKRSRAQKIVGSPLTPNEKEPPMSKLKKKDLDEV
jgi:hypothetical protein